MGYVEELFLTASRIESARKYILTKIKELESSDRVYCSLVTFLGSLQPDDGLLIGRSPSLFRGDDIEDGRQELTNNLSYLLPEEKPNNDAVNQEILVEIRVQNNIDQIKEEIMAKSNFLSVLDAAAESAQN